MLNEKDVEHALRVEFRVLGYLVEKIHGNLYQSGLPDLLITTNTGHQFWVEVKRGACTSVPECHRKLKGRQVQIIQVWGHRGVPVYVVGSEDLKTWWCVSFQNTASIQQYESVEELVKTL